MDNSISAVIDRRAVRSKVVPIDPQETCRLFCRRPPVEESLAHLQRFLGSVLSSRLALNYLEAMEAESSPS